MVPDRGAPEVGGCTAGPDQPEKGPRLLDRTRGGHSLKNRVPTPSLAHGASRGRNNVREGILAQNTVNGEGTWYHVKTPLTVD